MSRVYANEGDARTASSAAHARAAHEPVSLSLTLALGRADLHPEAKVAITDFKAAINAVGWLITEIAHTLNDRGFTTQLKMKAA